MTVSQITTVLSQLVLMPTHLVALACVLAFFHGSEFLLAWAFMRDELGWHSWLISKQYCMAMAFALLEYALEVYLLPGIKAGNIAFIIACTGAAMVVIGEAIRKLGMVTAKSNFTHQIKFQKREGHHLVTWGIYRYIRHPGYLGWFIWAVGTQFLIVNPISIILFTYVSWGFFKQRIATEEWYLSRFFGSAYTEYAQRTPTFIPFIA